MGALTATNDIRQAEAEREEANNASNENEETNMIDDDNAFENEKDEANDVVSHDNEDSINDDNNAFDIFF